MGALLPSHDFFGGASSNDLLAGFFLSFPGWSSPCGLMMAYPKHGRVVSIFTDFTGYIKLQFLVLGIYWTQVAYKNSGSQDKKKAESEVFELKAKVAVLVSLGLRWVALQL